MVDYIGNILREFPAIPVFLTVGLGFFFGRLKFKGFSLGSVTAGLLVGIVIGQIFHVQVSDDVKNMFFMLFLFSIGYSVGPDFFRSLKGSGLKQALFAVIMSFSCFLAVVGLGRIMGYSSGEVVGMFSGSQTCSALLGVGSEAIQNGAGTAAEKAAQLNMIPVCYAVTYVFGTLGTVVILSMLGPRLLGGIEKIKREAAHLQSEYSQSPWRDDPAYRQAENRVTYRTFKVTAPEFENGTTVKTVEYLLHSKGARVFIDRIHRMVDDTIVQATDDTLLVVGDIIVVSGRLENVVEAANYIGPETADVKLLDFPVKQAPVLLRNREVDGNSLGSLLKQQSMHGVMVKEVERGGQSIEVKDDATLKLGDILTLVGARQALNFAAKMLGHIDRPTIHTDIMFLCLSLFVGGIFGTVTVHFGRVPLSFGTSGGSLVAGIVFGWLRTRRPTYGKIPRSVVWFLNQLGLNVFIAVVGLNCGPQFISGIKTAGWMLPVVAAIATTLPLLLGLWLGAKIFKFPAVFTLGCCAGTRTCTAALGAAQDAVGSTLPTIGYTVTYAVSNIMLIVWGLLSVLLT